MSWRTADAPVWCLARRLLQARTGLAVGCVITVVGGASCQSSHAGPFQLAISDVGPSISNEVRPQGPSGRVISLAIAADGERMYAGTWGGGVWRSNNAGVTWNQLVSEQTGDDVLPGCDESDAPARLAASTIPALAVSPDDRDLVFAGTSNDREDCNGVYRSDDGGDSWHRVFHQPTASCPGGTADGYPGAEQPVTELAFAPDDATKVWAVAGCAVAFSTASDADPASRPTAASADQVGQEWRTSTEALPLASHLAVGSFNGSYGPTGGRAVWVCAPPSPTLPGGGVWSSINGGETFKLVRPRLLAGNLWCNGDNPRHEADGSGEHQLAADDSGSQPIAYALAPPSSTVGQHAIAYTDNTGTAVSVSLCGCFGVTKIARSGPADAPTFAVTGLAGPPSMPDTRGSGELLLSGYWSGRRLMLVLSNDEDFFVAQAPVQGEASWHRLTGIDADEGCTSTTSCSATAGWYPHDRSPTPVALHDDAHAFAITPGTIFTVGRPGIMSSPAGRCTPVAANVATMALANDGGIAVSPDCGARWRYGDLPNIPANELGGVARRGLPPALYFGGRDDGNWVSLDGGQHWDAAIPGCGDCTGFYDDPRDPSWVATVFRCNLGGPNCSGPQNCCRWMLSKASGIYPDPRQPLAAQVELTPYINWPRMSTDRGWGPIVQARSTEPLPDLPSVVAVSAVAATDSAGNVTSLSGWTVHRETFTASTLLRTSGSFRDQQIGAEPNLPYPIVQTSGGLAKTTFYAAGRPPSTNLGDYINAETDKVKRADPAAYTWKCIVPSTARCVAPSHCPDSEACHAYKLAVDPYGPTHSQRIYLTDEDGNVKESLDSGESWFTNTSLTTWMTDQHRLNAAPHCQWSCAWGDSDEELHRMLFVPDEPGTAFAAGITGVYMTLDAGCNQSELNATACSTHNGEKWHRILDSTATPCQPNGLFFDPVEADGRALYVSCSQRGVLKILGIPRPQDEAALDQRRTRITVERHDRPPPYIQPRTYKPSPPESSTMEHAEEIKSAKGSSIPSVAPTPSYPSTKTRRS
jgi:hypothetical protein